MIPGPCGYLNFNCTFRVDDRCTKDFQENLSITQKSIQMAIQDTEEERLKMEDLASTLKEMDKIYW